MTRAAPRRTKTPAKSRAVTFDTVREIALALPGAEEGTSFGTPAFRVNKKLFARLREDGDSLVVKIDFDERDLLMEAEPQTFYITDHYRDYPTVLVRLTKVRPEVLREVLEESWRRSAGKRLLSAFDRQRTKKEPRHE